MHRRDARVAPDGSRRSDELREEATLPHPVRRRSVILLAEPALDLSRELQSCVAPAGKTPTAVQAILRKLAGCTPKAG